MTKKIRRKTTKKNKRKVLRIIVKFGIVCIILVSCFEVKAILKAKREDDNIKENYIVLQNLEKGSITSVEEKIKEKQVDNSYDDEVRDYTNEDDEYEKKSNNKDEKEKDSKSNRVYFEDSVFMGDSITEPLDFYNILNKSSVLAKKGQNVIKAKEAAAKLANIKPKRIFILYGANDLELFSNPEDFKKRYTALVEEIKKQSQNTEIYVQSVTPIQQKVQNRNRKFSQERVEEFREKVREIANEQSVHYIDITSIISDRDDLYEPDGIHFKIGFYKLWLDYLKNNLEKNN